MKFQVHDRVTDQAVNPRSSAGLFVSCFGEYQLMNSPFGPAMPFASQAAVYLLSTSVATFVPSRTSLYLIAMIYGYISSLLFGTDIIATLLGLELTGN